MKPLFVSLRLHEIHHLKNLLESAGISCFLRNEHLSTLAGEVPFAECAAQLWLVHESDRSAAEAILREWRRPRPAGPAWRCERCGEALEGQFTSCWKCGRERP
jgi:hypothetical protein